MLDKLSSALDLNRQALSLRSHRQEVLANNIANNDTPNYKARDFNFSKALSQAVGSASGDVSLTTTNSRHIQTDGGTAAGSAKQPDLAYRTPLQPSLDGNTVDMDQERTQFADNAVRYQADLTLLNSRIRGIKAAMQPIQ